MDTESPQLRLSILAITALSLFGALFARLWYLQVMSTDQFQTVAAANRERVLYEEPARGRILDRNGDVLVDNRTSLVLAITKADPALKSTRNDIDEEKVTALLTRVATELTRVGKPTKVASLRRRLDDPQFNPITPIPMANDIPEELQVVLAERPAEFPGVTVKRQSVRNYKTPGLAAHVLGWVGRINQKEYEAKAGTPNEPLDDPKYYQPDSPYGKAGIEAVYESDLRGTPGIRRVEVDPFGRVVRTLDYTPPVPGNDVQLSIDTEVQIEAEKTLIAQLDKVRGLPTGGIYYRNANAGSVVVNDPRNGDVIAMASYPTFDPAEFVNGITQERYDQFVKGKASDNPLLNRSISEYYSPASTFKLVTAYAAVTSGMISPEEQVPDSGEYHMIRCTLGCIKTNAQGAAHGMVDLPRALSVSSDVYFYAIGDKFYWEHDHYGDALQDSARKFGFGSKAGIDLPQEVSGVVPDAAWKKELFEAMSPDEQKGGNPLWQPYDSVDMAIGQGNNLATPLQIAYAYAAFADGGKLHQPRLVLRVLKPAGDPTDPNAVVRSIDPKVTSEFPIPGELSRAMHQGFRGVTDASREGTAWPAFQGFDTDAWPVIAKTGTGETGRPTTDNALFAGCGPDPNEEYCLSVVLEEAGFGGEVAAPIGRRLFEVVSGQGCEVEDEESTGTSASTTSTTFGSTGTTPDPDACEPWQPGVPIGVTSD